MTQRKVCLIGSFAAGKTSLVSRYVHSIFSEKYLTTVGVRIERKSVRAASGDLDLILWDLHGEDEFQKVRASYLRGSSGFIVVVDGTRRETFDKALLLHDEATRVAGPAPAVFALNKADLGESWEISDDAEAMLAARGATAIRTSAKSGAGVEELFAELALRMSKA
jgi:small GTP-binding protein